MLQLSRSRLSMSVASIAAALAFAAPAFAMPPEVTLTAPSGRQAVNPPAFTGTAGKQEWESREIAVDVWAGDGGGRQAAGRRQRRPRPRDRRVQRHARRRRCRTAPTPPARASATASRRRATRRRSCSSSAPRPSRRPRRPRPRRHLRPHPPVVAAPRPAPSFRRPAVTPYVCASRRDFTKHVFRPYGTDVRVKATLDGRARRAGDLVTCAASQGDLHLRVDLPRTSHPSGRA